MQITNERLNEMINIQEGIAEDAVRGNETVHKLDSEILSALKELKEYRDIGPTPEQLKEIDRLYMKKCREVDGLKKWMINQWIPITQLSARKDLPANEEEVEITYVYKDDLTEKTAYGTARALYEDGTHTVEDSAFEWDDTCDFEYDEEKDAYIIPDGWWESTKFAEICGMIDCKVIAWRPIQEPYREDKCCSRIE